MCWRLRALCSSVGIAVGENIISMVETILFHQISLQCEPEQAVNLRI